MATTNITHPKITIELVRTLLLSNQSYSLRLLVQVLDRLTTKDVLRGVLHSILFHRLFGTVKPQTFEVLDVTMVRTSIQTLYLFPLSVGSNDLTSTARGFGCGNGAAGQREGRCILEGHRGWG